MPLPATTQNGQPFDLATVKGWKVVYFWSSSCPCVKRCEAISLLPLARQYAGRVSFFAVAANAANLRYSRPSQPTAPINALKEAVALELSGDDVPRLPFSLLLDKHHALANALHATHTPEAFLLDAHNRILFHGDPDDSASTAGRTSKAGVTRRYLADALRAALAGKSVPLAVAPMAGCEIDRSEAAEVNEEPAPFVPKAVEPAKFLEQ